MTCSHPAVKVCLGAKAGRGLRSCQVPELHGEQDMLGEPPVGLGPWNHTVFTHNCLLT